MQFLLVVPLHFVHRAMVRRGGRTTPKKGSQGTPSSSKKPKLTSAMASSPERSEVAGQSEPSGLANAATVSNTAAPLYITEKVFSSAMIGLEERLVALIASQCGSKSDRSPSITQDPQTEELGSGEDEFLSGEREEADDSSSEGSNAEGPPSASQSER